MKGMLFIGIWKISRPVNVLIAMLSIGVAAFITGTLQPFSKVILAIFAGAFIAAGANTINDYFDLEIDRVNKPRRPLPAGLLSPQAALRLAIIEFLLGITASLLINGLAFGIAILFSALLFFYSFKLKRLPLWGNLAVSLSTAAAFVFGGVAVNRIRLTFIPAALAFFYHFGREIIKDIQDMKGDARKLAKTFPLVFGKTAALRLTTLNYILLIILTILPFVFHWYGTKYFLTVVIGIYPVLLYSLVSIWKNQSPSNLGFVSNLLKADMLVGLLAIYLG
ncbi:MAG: geranylgeranylglycerol-phosphate geranylgeranyltransferase [Calditrichia bacterium]